MGVRGIALKWLKCYLSNRKTYVSFLNEKLLYNEVTCGVLQGSIIGPLLIILYINDNRNISDFIDFILYADDTTIINAHKDTDVLY